MAFTPALENKIRWGIIGCGNVTEVKSGPGFQQALGSELVAVMRRSATLAEDYARRHGVPRWYTEASALIDDPEVDAVYVATPVGQHMEYALSVCAAGKPCYVEKPMARHYLECLEMVRAFNDKHLPLFVAYYRRALPRFLKVKELIAAGRLGTIESINYQYASIADVRMTRNTLPWRLVASEAGGGLFLDLGSHALDLFDFLFGPLHFIKGGAARRGAHYDVEDWVKVEFTAGEEKAKGIAQWDFCAAQPEDRIAIMGTKGRVMLSTFGNEPVHFEPVGEDFIDFDLPNPLHVQLPLIQLIVDELLGRGHSPSTGRTAARTSHIMDQVLNDFYGGRDDSFWLRSDTWPGTR